MRFNFNYLFISFIKFHSIHSLTFFSVLLCSLSSSDGNIVITNVEWSCIAINNFACLLHWSKKNNVLLADVLRNERRHGLMYVSDLEEEGEAFFRSSRSFYTSVYRAWYQYTGRKTWKSYYKDAKAQLVKNEGVCEILGAVVRSFEKTTSTEEKEEGQYGGRPFAASWDGLDTDNFAHSLCRIVCACLNAINTETCGSPREDRDRYPFSYSAALMSYMLTLNYADDQIRYAVYIDEHGTAFPDDVEVDEDVEMVDANEFPPIPSA